MVVWVYTLVFFDEFFEFVLTEYAHVVCASLSFVEILKFFCYIAF